MIQDDSQSAGAAPAPTPGEPEFALTSVSGDSVSANSAAPEKTSPDLTPFMRQWAAGKRQNPDALLFFRMGDF